MRAVRKRISGILITLYMLLIGICCVGNPADSLFARNAFEDPCGFICVDEGSACNTDVCTFEMLSARSASAVQYVQRHSLSERTISFLSVIYLAAEILAVLGVFFAAYVFSIRAPGCHAVIVNYIHRKDGKK